METPIPPFNLLDEPWLPCVLAADGVAVDLSLRDALVRAHELRELADSSPLVTAALHRLLLAVLHRNFGPRSAPAWAALWRAGRFDAATLDAYFADQRPRFNLFDNTWPFYQTTRVEFDYAKPIATMVYGLTMGNYVTLFDHTTEAAPVALRPADAARNLVAFQAFALGGLVSLRKGEPVDEYKAADAAPLAKGAVALVGGATLFETLMLNLVRYDRGAGEPFPFDPDNEDVPAWEREEPTLAEDRRPNGYIDLLTWQSRRMRLRPSVEPDGSVVVRQAVIMKGNQFRDDFKQATAEPMLAFSEIKKPAAGQAPYAVLPFRRDKALWRDSQALYDATGAGSIRPPMLTWLGTLEEQGIIPETAVYDLDVLGMCIDRASVFFWRHERLPLPLSIVDDVHAAARIARALKMADDVGKLFQPGIAEWVTTDGRKVTRPRPLHVFAQTMLSPTADRQPDSGDVGKLVESLQAGQTYWARLEAKFRTFVEALARSDDAGVAALAGWTADVKAVARAAFTDALAGFDTSARALKAAALAWDAFERQLGVFTKGYGLSRKEGLDAAAS